MRLERISENKIKFSISVEELEQKGLFEQDKWKDSLSWHDLFDDMLDEVQGKFGIEAHMEITVEIESFDEQEICLILTLELDDEDYSDIEGSLELIQPVMETDMLFYFYDLDGVIDVLKRLKDTQHLESCTLDISLLHMENKYYLLFENVPQIRTLSIESIVLEYGESSNQTTCTMLEYGHPIILKQAMEMMTKYF
ncbi:adaptor protein MecA [Rossellomorea aquimaris]|uniref:adaptor protein MecA n=1 Tax=Rossellomorea aquimaris TaxID=189382 RepID=UPI001CD4B415|nr:adaptor protein MecA [Rossellomorea aquimaris]MCA1054669.1 adaptor protein MecA [Rossellomorea aquimaris]